MQIGSATFTVQARPADLDAQLVASLGCDAREVAAMLASNPIAGVIAAAVAPFIKGGPSVPELASVIADAGTEAVAASVLELYAADVPAIEQDAPSDD